ncbi:MAG: serine hydrolase [Archangium sp.]|nr:serine hydrolase [Archangium sp.]
MKKKLLLGCGAFLLFAVITVIALLASGPGRQLTEFVGYIIETDEPDIPDTPALIAYLEAHPDRYALAAWEVGREDAGIFHDADSLWPLASTVKIIPIALASEEIAAGRWDPTTPTPEVENFYLAGTDGNAHPEASVDGGTATIAGALHGMIRWSDNAATDAILFRLGRERLTSTTPGLPTPHPLSGTMLLSNDGFTLDSGVNVDDAAWARAGQLAANPPGTTPPAPPFVAMREQVRMTRELDNKGSARAFAQLIERIFLDESEKTAVARKELQWPMEFQGNLNAFKVFGTKGGSLAGTLTSATYMEDTRGNRRVVALFLHDIPFATWMGLMSNYLQQDLERELLTEDGAIERLRPRLGK